jgi:hypothetical protein
MRPVKPFKPQLLFIEKTIGSVEKSGRYCLRGLEGGPTFNAVAVWFHGT